MAALQAGPLGAGVCLAARASTARRPGSRQRAATAAATRCCITTCADSSTDPLLVRAARGERTDRAPAWMMRQAGRYMKAYQKLAEKHPSFRERSETTDLIVEISLQPWRAFKPDGVILFSDILTPLPALGVPFDIDDVKGPILAKPCRTAEQVAAIHALDTSILGFVGDSLRLLRKEVAGSAAVLGFVGSPWTLATYIVEGGSSRTYQIIKDMAWSNPTVLHALLAKLADAIAEYIGYQIEAGAQAVQIFDSWGGQLTPADWDKLSRPYIEQMVKKVKAKYPQVSLTLYANGMAGLLERMAGTGVDVVGLDWSIDMADARKRLNSKIAVQGNVDPAVLFASPAAISVAVNDVLRKAGPAGHILNLGHGVLVGTPEEGVAAFFDAARAAKR